MATVRRRDWLKMLAAAGLMSGLPGKAQAKPRSAYRFTDVRVAISPDNPAIIFDESKCILCGACYRVCNRKVSVTGHYDLAKTGDRPVCVHCGQCSTVCEGDAILNRPEWQAIQAAKARGQKVVVSLSPAVRVMVSEVFGQPAGTYCEGEVIAALRALGVDYVIDTAVGADLTIVEEAAEWVERLRSEDAILPQFTSCCPSWVKFCETFFPEFLPHLSSVKSPIGIQGAMIKRFFAKSLGLDPKQLFSVALTPCTAKKFEIRRPELVVDGLAGMDAVVTVRELADWIAAEGVDYRALQPSRYDTLMGDASGAGVIFGNTGGVAEAILRSAYFMMNGTNPPESWLTFTELRGLRGSQGAQMGGVKEATVHMTPSRTVKVVVAQGLAQVRKILGAIREGTFKADFIEVMACEGGCIGGGGTPRAKHVPYLSRAMRQARIAALYTGDTSRKVRLAHENPLVKRLYAEDFGTFLSPTARQVMHTSYQSRAKDLG